MNVSLNQRISNIHKTADATNMHANKQLVNGEYVYLNIKCYHYLVAQLFKESVNYVNISHNKNIVSASRE